MTWWERLLCSVGWHDEARTTYPWGEDVQCLRGCGRLERNWTQRDKELWQSLLRGTLKEKEKE